MNELDQILLDLPSENLQRISVQERGKPPNLRGEGQEAILNALFTIFRTLVSGDGSSTKRRRRKGLSLSAQIVRHPWTTLKVKLVSVVM